MKNKRTLSPINPLICLRSTDPWEDARSDSNWNSIQVLISLWVTYRVMTDSAHPVSLILRHSSGTTHEHFTPSSTCKVSFIGPGRHIEAILWLNCEWLNLMRHLKSQFFSIHPSRNIFWIGSQKRSTSIKHVPSNHRKRTERKIDRACSYFPKDVPSMNLTTSGWMRFFRVRKPVFLHRLNARESQLWERTNRLCRCFHWDLMAHALSSIASQAREEFLPRLNMNTGMGWTSFDSHIHSFQIMDHLTNEKRSNSVRSQFNRLASGKDHINREQASEFIHWWCHRQDAKRCLSLVEVILKLGIHHRETALNDLLYDADIDGEWLCWTRRDKRVSSIH